MEWILVAYIYAGALATGDSVALQAIKGFKTEISCQEAGKALNPLVSATAKNVRFVCVKQ